MAMPQNSHKNNNVQCSSSLPQSAEVTYVEELMAEHPSGNIAFMGWEISAKADDNNESLVVEGEDDASTPVQECEAPFQQESTAGAKLPATMLMAQNNVFPIQAEGNIVTGSNFIC